MNRLNRRTHEPEVGVGHQETARKFGNIVNRPDKYGQSTEAKPDASMKRYNDIQNSKPYSLYRQEENKFQVQRQGPEIGYQDKQSTSQLLYHQAQGQGSFAREPTGKNREFVAKVENINKIHDQIHSMLKIVKNVESKSVVKLKQEVQDRQPVRTYENIERIMKHRLRENPETIKKAEIAPPQKVKQDYKFEDQIILPITSNARRRVETSTIDAQRRSELSNFQETRKHPKLMGYYGRSQENKLNTEKYQKHLNSKSILEKQQEPIQLYARGREYNKEMLGLSPSPIRKEVDLAYTPKKAEKKQERPKKQTYSYNFQSKDDLVDVVVSRNIAEERPDKLERSAIDYDYEISKVKQRIQSSEQMTKKMEQRYLGAGHGQSKHSDKSRIKEDKLQARQKFMEQLQSEEDKLRNKFGKAQQRKYEDSLDLRQDFQIKVLPCKQTSHQPPMKKDQICKLISQKLSQQIKRDQKLRDARQKFSNCKIDQKWQILQQKLKSLGFSISEAELENELMISPNEINPFNLDDEYEGNSVDALADAYAEAEKYWQRNIYHSMSKSRLANCGFSPKEMDLDRRGYLTVEDLVCFVNLHSTNFFRNRDVIHLFKRMVATGKNRNGVQYETFMTIVAHQ